MKGNEIGESAKKLIANLFLWYDSISFQNNKKRLLLVEGTTDKDFIERITNKNDVYCVTPNNSVDSAPINNKEAIVQALFGLFRPEILDKTDQQNVRKLKEKVKDLVFGMVDLDYDDPSSYEPMPWLFVTDTHDLETLLLSTDEDLVRRLKIPEDYSKKAYYLAYQLGFLRREVAKQKTFLKPIKCEADYETFVDGNTYKINLEKLLEFFSYKKKKEEILKSKEIKKKIDKDSLLWKGDLKDFDKSTYADFWQVVNGHEILSLIRYIYQQEADEGARNEALPLLHADFEKIIITKYDCSTLEKTKIYDRMKNENVVDSDKIKILDEHESR